MINPIFFKGANTALLAPTTKDTSPFIILLYSSYFSPSLKELWNTATLSPNTPLKRATIWGVKDISGTNTMPVLFNFKTRFKSSIYTSVLPLPVTPYNKNLSSLEFNISFTAFNWPSVKLISFFKKSVATSRLTSYLFSTTIPFSINFFNELPNSFFAFSPSFKLLIILISPVFLLCSRI